MAVDHVAYTRRGRRKLEEEQNGHICPKESTFQASLKTVSTVRHFVP